MPARVVDAEESRILDAVAIAAGVPSRALMRSAAFNAATIICGRYPEILRRGATILTGPGNNGGDGWALAGALDRAGVNVAVREIVPARSPDAIAERNLSAYLADSESPLRDIIVDAMLGTGSSGVLRDSVLDAAYVIRAARSRGSTIIALDLPSGVDAALGATEGCVEADLTISFASCKRGALVSRAQCGEIVVVDIGIGADDSSLPDCIDAMFVRCNVPAIAADSNKGSRRSVAIVAGAEFMGGAAILAAIGALRSGAGLVKVITAPQNIVAVHARIPEALTAPLSDTQRAVDDWADVLLIGPGLGRSIEARSTIKGLLTRSRGPVVVDADALNAFDGRLDALGDLLRGRPAVVTPHPGEMSRLMGCDVAEVLANRFDIGLELARRIDAAVLLKGTPTVVSAPDGRRFVSATGTAALATGGSGDALGGIVATLLAQGCDPAVAAACAAWIHGRAAELTPGVRGNRLSEVLDRLQDAWTTDMAAPAYPVLACLPAVA